jgi:hypothetical protein
MRIAVGRWRSSASCRPPEVFVHMLTAMLTFDDLNLSTGMAQRLLEVLQGYGQ